MANSEGSGRTALITGASAGIGTALARVFAEHGFGLVNRTIASAMKIVPERIALGLVGRQTRRYRSGD